MSLLRRMSFNLLLTGMLYSLTGSVGFCAEVLWEKDWGLGLPDTPAVIADITADPGFEIAFATTNGKLVVCSVQGELLWVAKGYSTFCNPPTPANLFAGAGHEILAINMHGNLICFSSKGEELWNYPFPSAVDWCQTTIVAADLDGDSTVEILCGDSKGQFVCLDRYGIEKWKFEVPGGFHCPPAVGDLDGDATPEIVITSPEGSLLALDNRGKVIWDKPLGCDNISGPVIVDVDGDKQVEIIVGGKDAKLHCFSNTGDLKWESPLEKESDSSISVGDIIGDQRLEILCMDLAGNCFCFDADGKELWKKNFGMRSRRPPSLADFNGDGQIEVLVSGYFSAYVLLSNQGEELDRVAGQPTNGGAVLVNYDGRLAAVIPGDGGKFSCLTWQKEKSAELPKILWGMYRYDVGQTGFVSGENPYKEPKAAPADASNKSFNTIISSLKEVLPDVKQKIDDFSGMRERFDANQIDLPGLLRTEMLLTKTLQTGEDCLKRIGKASHEEVLATCQRTFNALESLKLLEKRAKAILEMEKDGSIPKMAVWSTNPWWHIRDVGEETDEWLGAKDIALSLYRNEVESGAFNIMNLEDHPVTVRVLAPSSLGEGNGPVLRLYEVISVPTEMEDFSDDALSEMNQAQTIHVAPGETRQIFVSVFSEGAPAGAYECDITVAPIAVESNPMPIHLKAEVLDLDIMDGEAFKLCTWGYVSGSLIRDYPKEAWENRFAHGNNVIVITTNYLPQVFYNENGEITSELDFDPLRQFIKDRPGAFFLFFNYGSSLKGPKEFGRFSEPYNKAFNVWAHKLVEVLKELGIGYDGFALYPVDEPGLRAGLVDLHIDYAKLARAADPKILMYTDPVDGAKMDDIQRMADYVDIWCPHRGSFLINDEEPRLDVIKQNAVKIWTYECWHHAKHRPPLEYYRGLAWLALHRGLSGFGFWTFCTSQDDPWGYPIKRGHDYLLIYPGKGIVTSRRWESCRDGSEDMRAVSILKKHIEEKANDPKAKEVVDEARKTIDAAAKALGQFCIDESKLKGIDRYGRAWIKPKQVDQELEAYREHRKKIAKMTLKLGAN